MQRMHALMWVWPVRRRSKGGSGHRRREGRLEGPSVARMAAHTGKSAPFQRTADRRAAWMASYEPGDARPFFERLHRPSPSFNRRLHHFDGERTLQYFVPGISTKWRPEYRHQESTQSQFPGRVIIVDVEIVNINAKGFRKSPHQPQHGSVGNFKIDAEIRVRGNLELALQWRISLIPHHLHQTSKVNVNSVFIFARHLGLSLGYVHLIIARDTGPHIPAVTLTQPCRAWARTRSCCSGRA